MGIHVQFRLDTRTSNEVVTVETPFDDRSKAADKAQSLLSDTASSSSAMMRIRDAQTGDYVFINTMKLQSVVVRDKDE